MKNANSYLSSGGSDTPRAIHDAGDGSESLPIPPDGILPPQIGGDGRSDHVGRTSDEEARDGQQDGVGRLVVRRV